MRKPQLTTPGPGSGESFWKACLRPLALQQLQVGDVSRLALPLRTQVLTEYRPCCTPQCLESLLTACLTNVFEFDPEK